MIKKLFIFLSLFFISCPVFAASKLETASIRLERLSPNVSPLKVLVTAATNTMVVEDGVRVLIGQGWSQSGTVTVSTVGLPSGVTAWPGISPKLVNGKNLEFNSGDLSPGVNYGFFITGGIGNNPETTLPLENYRWRISTYRNGTEDSTLEQQIKLVSNDSITITGKTPPRVVDFVADITSNNDSKAKQNLLIDYNIKFGSNLPYDTPKDVTVVAEWLRATVDGRPAPEVDVFEYVLGTATTGYQGVEPVVDVINRQISWTFKGLPKQKTNFNVGFRLKTNDIYKNPDQLILKVKSKILFAGSSTLDSVSTHYYNYEENPRPTSGIAKVENKISPTPTGIVNKENQVIINSKVNSVSIDSIDQNSSKISFGVDDEKSILKVSYGKKINNLDKEMTILSDDKNASLNFDNLEPGTIYYFKVANSNEIFSFKTAEISTKAEVDPTSLIVSSNNNILLSTKGEIQKLNSTPSRDNSIVMTSDQDFTLRIALKKSELVKNIQVFVRNRGVLGISSEKEIIPNYGVADLLETEPGIYVGRMLTPKDEGLYELYARVSDYNGNVIEQKIGQIRVISPLLIYSEKIKQPIENAKITLSIFNQKNKMYELISSDAMSIKNPSYSEPNGKVYLSLPRGEYMAEIEAVGYKNQEVKFSIGDGESQKYPVVYMVKSPVSISSINKFYQVTAVDLYRFTERYLNDLSSSSRFFYVIVTILIATLIGLSLLSFSLRIKIPLWLLPEYFAYHFSKIWDRNKINRFVEGQVVDIENNWPISRAEVYLIDAIENKIISKTFTDKIGSFYLKLTKVEDYKIVVIKKGFEPTSMMEFRKEALALGEIELTMRKREEMEIEKTIKWALITVLETLFEFIMVITVIFELMFVKTFGWFKTMPFLIISLFNLTIWMVYLYKLFRNRNKKY